MVWLQGNRGLQRRDVIMALLAAGDLAAARV